MKRYPVYKDSGVEWIRDVPKHWDIKKLKYLVKLINEIGAINGNGIRIDLENIESWTGRLIKNEPLIVLDEEMKRFIIGDVLFNKLRPYLAKVFHASHDGICGSELLVLRPTALVDSKFLYYRAISSDFIKVIDGSTYGTKMPRASWDFIGKLFISYPSNTEQRNIANFLDRKSAQIDDLIFKKERMIELLKEERIAVINQAVTKGLDPNVEMKDSGIEWIGKIPKHWEIKKLKHTTYIKGRIGWQALTTNEYIKEGPYLVTGTDFDDGIINWDRCFHVAPERYEMDSYIQLQNDDLLITKDGTIGKVAVVKNMPDKTTLNSGVFLTRPLYKDIYMPEFMFWILSSDIFLQFIDYTKKGSTISHLYQEVFREFIYAVPELQEQKTITEYLVNKTDEMDSIIIKQEQQIELLKEYRTALISEAVTGKIDVREESVCQK